MPGLFLITAMFLSFGAVEYEACKKDGIDNVKICAERVAEVSTPVDYSKMND